MMAVNNLREVNIRISKQGDEYISMVKNIRMAVNIGRAIVPAPAVIKIVTPLLRLSENF